MIVATGLSPAWQRIYLFDDLHVGGVNRARQGHACASGKVVNVAVALAHLGTQGSMVTMTGGATGNQIEAELASLNVVGRFIRSSASTRVCTTILDERTKTTTELVENVGPVSAAEVDALVASHREIAANAKAVVLTGSLPQGAPATLYQNLIRGSAAPAILDARGEELALALSERPLLVKPNAEELARTVGRELGDDAAIWNAMREIQDRGAQWVLVSQGAHPAFLLGPSVKMRVFPAPATVVNPIGCGDCLAAGVAWGIAEGLDMVDAVARGIAAAADNLSKLLPARLDRDRVLALAKLVKVEAV